MRVPRNGPLPEAAPDLSKILAMVAHRDARAALSSGTLIYSESIAILRALKPPTARMLSTLLCLGSYSARHKAVLCARWAGELNAHAHVAGVAGSRARRELRQLGIMESQTTRQGMTRPPWYRVVQPEHWDWTAFAVRGVEVGVHADRVDWERVVSLRGRYPVQLPEAVREKYGLLDQVPEYWWRDPVVGRFWPTDRLHEKRFGGKIREGLVKVRAALGWLRQEGGYDLSYVSPKKEPPPGQEREPGGRPETREAE